MKHVFWLPIGIAIAAGAAMAVLRATTDDHDPHTREVTAVAAITIFACFAALLPIGLARHAGPVPAFQAALGGTVIHLFLMIGLAGAVVALNLVGDRRTFAFLILTFYFPSLVGLVIPMIRVFRDVAERARVAAAAAGAAASKDPQASTAAATAPRPS